MSLCLAPHAFCDSTQHSKEKKATNDRHFHKTLLEIASEYKSYGKVDDMAKWAPWQCAAPPPPVARRSQSRDPNTHGRKLYFLFARDRNDYIAKENPKVGQTIVKESWIPDTSQTPKPDRQGDIFIMTKIDPATKNTDNGWIYGTVTPDGKTVTSAGRVESCMKCHLEAKNDRLFGLKENLPVIKNQK